MSRVEVVIEYGMPGRDLLRFRRWLVGWLYDRYGASSIKVAEDDDRIVFEVDGDMFDLFDELRIEVRLALRDIGADVKAFGVCSGDECIAVYDFSFDMVLSSDVIKRLKKVVNKVARIAGVEKVEGIGFAVRGGMLVVYMDGCCAKLYANEAFVVGVDMVKFIEDAAGLKILGDVGFVYDVVEPPEPRSLDIDFLVGEDGVALFVNSCSRDLKFGEALRLAYWLMRLSLNVMEVQKIIEGGYE
jgi:hypothetical protein